MKISWFGCIADTYFCDDGIRIMMICMMVVVVVGRRGVAAGGIAMSTTTQTIHDDFIDSSTDSASPDQTDAKQIYDEEKMIISKGVLD